MKLLLRRLMLGLLALSLLIAGITAFTPQGRAAVKTALFIPQVLPKIPFKPQTWVTGDPVWQKIRFPQAHGEGVADLITPAGEGKHSAVLFFTGVVVDNPRNDPRMVNLAEGLARSGMVVMIPWMDTQEKQHIVVDDIDNLVHAFQFLRSHESVDPNKVGMGGICTGASMATVAAQDERIRRQVVFVNFFAGYYDAVDFARAIGSRSRFYQNDYVAPWEPDDLTLRVMRYHLIDGVSNQKDKIRLIAMYFPKDNAQPPQPIFESDEGRAVHRLLNGVSYEEVDELMTYLSPKTMEFLRTVSPSTKIDRLEARVLMMHDRGDKLVPSEESRRFADALGRDSDTYHTEFSLFQKQIQMHVDESVDVDAFGFVKEAYKLSLHIYNIMRDL